MYVVEKRADTVQTGEEVYRPAFLMVVSPCASKERPGQAKVRVLWLNGVRPTEFRNARTLPRSSGCVCVLTRVFLLLPQSQVPNEKASTAKVCTPAASKTGSS